MSPSPNRRHQQLSKRLQYELYRHVEVDHRLGEIYPAPFDVILADDNVAQPDLIFVTAARQALFSQRGLDGAPTWWSRSSRRARGRATGARSARSTRASGCESCGSSIRTATRSTCTSTNGELVVTRTFGRDDTLVSRVLPGLRLELAPVFA